MGDGWLVDIRSCMHGVSVGVTCFDTVTAQEGVDAGGV
ncbi:hypothetical protein SDC9_145442 [bioreactor metagenome]|uniref:Uncharacterized protein n=1 Tax=bioreactor metagenome TaxID=1076179 RepID=A0A645E8N1_9ZZZZ